MKSNRDILNTSTHVILRVAKGFAFLFALILSLSACTDYEADYEDMYGYMLGTLTDARDGQTYKTVTIGTQTWMGENLNYDYNEGTARSYCYNGRVDFCAKYGRLYLWSAAMDSAAVFSTAGKGCGYGKTCSPSGTIRGVCPEGWHLPNDDEWNTLFDAVGGTSTAGTKLKSTSGWNRSGNGADSYGFGVLPAGYRTYGGDFYYAGSRVYFWSSTEYNSDDAYSWYFRYDDEYVYRNDDYKNFGYSVRCLRDSNDEGSEASSLSSQTKSSSSSIASSSSSSVIPSGAEESITYGTLTDARDGLTYKTVTIGTQTWMAENLNYAYNEPTSSLDSSSFCNNNSVDSCAKYGRLYLWSAAMDSAAVFSDAGKGCGYGETCSPSGTIRGVCPKGWHLPNDDEWNTLFDVVGGTGTAGMKLKSTSGWILSENGADPYGFGVLPAGYRDGNGDFSNAGIYAGFWSSTEGTSSSAFDWSFSYNFEHVGRYYHSRNYGYSVRCLRDSNDEGSEASSSNSQTKSSSSSIASSSSSSVIPSGAEESITYGTLTDDRDNQTYKTVTIGTQTWMAENLNYAYNEPTSSLDSSSFCNNNSVDSCAKYGRLYLWSAAMDSAAAFSDAGKGCGYGKTCSPSGTIRGVCPKGWHLPSYDEWHTLFDAVGGTRAAGTKLKSTSGWKGSGNGTDSYGFGLLPAGFRDNYGNFSDVVDYADFWNSTEYGSYNAYRWYFYYYDEYAYRDVHSKDYGFSVRCLRDFD